MGSAACERGVVQTAASTIVANCTGAACGRSQFTGLMQVGQRRNRWGGDAAAGSVQSGGSDSNVLFGLGEVLTVLTVVCGDRLV